jgi:heme-degrading monooxygenase HmoA
MILQVASMMVRPDMQPAFEKALAKALRLLARADGYLAHELCRSIEREQHCALLVEWRSLEDHTRGFIGSNAFDRCRELLDPCLQAPLQIEHFETTRRPGPTGAGHAVD